ncbi:MAG: hypothetical protein KGS72_07790 [Cyanobacteria bacterium REEB67]|nr:hypothetical protein [Cyanobacteria bacterium REEB67]
MLSRRSFLFASLGGLVTAGELANPFIQPLAADAKKTPRTPLLVGPHSLSREDWAPAIMPDHVGIIGKGYLCFTDDFGRLAVVDLHHTAGEKSSLKIIGELNGIATKVIDFSFGLQTAYGLVYKENENQEPVVHLVTISLTSPATPTIVNQTVINRFTEGTAICAGNDMICISGISSSGEHIASIYSAPKRSSGSEPTYLASLTVQNPVRRVDLQERQLVILSSSNGGNSQVDLVDLSNPTSPTIRNSVTINGDCRVMARYKDTLIVAGSDSTGGHSCQVRAIALKNSGQGAGALSLGSLTSVFSAAASPKGDQFMLLGEANGERTVVLLGCDRSRTLIKQQELKLPSSKGEGASKGTVVMKEGTAYVAAGWSGVTMLSRGKEGLALGQTYSIPRLSAAGVASWGDLVVLAGAQLQLYSIAKPERPSLINWADPDAAIKSIVGAGSFVLCLSREELALRKMDKLRETAATLKIQASHVCFDNSTKTAFALKSQEKTTRVTRIKVYSNSMSADAPFEVPGIFNHCQAYNGMLLLSGLNDVALYRTGPSAAANPTISTAGSAASASMTAGSTGVPNTAALPSSNKSDARPATAGGAKAADNGKSNGSKAASANEAVKKIVLSPTPELIGSHHFDNLAVRDVAIGDDVIIATTVDQNSQGFFVVMSREDKDLRVLGSINLPSDGVALAVSGSKAVAVGRNLEGKDVASICSFANKINPQVLTTLAVIEGVSSVTIKDQMAVLAGRGLEILTLS